MLYDILSRRRGLTLSALILLVGFMAMSVFRLSYKEDIADFLPVDDDYRQAMQIYQEVSAGDRIVLQFSLSDTSRIDQELLVSAIAAYGDTLALLDTAHWVPDFAVQSNMDDFLDVMGLMYRRLPYLLTVADYAALDSAWQQGSADFITQRLYSTQHLLMSDAGAVLSDWLPYDPLGLFAPIGQRMKAFQPEQMTYQVYDGRLFSHDQRYAVVPLQSPFGSSETSGNGLLMQLLDETAARLRATPQFAQVEVTQIGAPVIAATNAQQIRHDSLWAISIAVVLILALLFAMLRSLRAMLLIGVSTAFGFLFALAAISLFRSDISVIVLGIAAAIIGIAVNYPLHFVCHLQHQPDARLTLRELRTPLLIGNVTTVGAFLTLVPLQAVAIRDLGIFSAMMLVGTILFVLIFLPHLSRGVYANDVMHDEQTSTPAASSGSRLLYSPWMLSVLAAITLFLGYFSLQTTFDSDLNHINYMTDSQRSDLTRLSQMQGEAQGITVYMAAQGEDYDEAAHSLERLSPELDRLQHEGLILAQRNPVLLQPSALHQQLQHERWIAFWQTHDLSQLESLAVQCGFAPGAFTPFLESVKAPFEPMTADEQALLDATILQGSANDHQIVAQLTVDPSHLTEVERRLQPAAPPQVTAPRVFDLTSLNRRITDSLSDDFNYIGLACGFIVFAFLWLSFRRLEIAVIAFLPMVIGWVWILGLMQLLGIQFNIVNVILATFIFGQGDDYTIFITEGLLRDYREGGRVLVSYRRSILLSALIMLIGIGALIVARHPAMHSLAEVTIVGMAVVVLMAWLIPPIAFHWFVRYDASLRRWLNNSKS